MTAYIKTIATNRNKYGLAWHGEDKNWPSLEPGDNVTTAMKKANDMLGVKVAKYPTYIHVGEHQILADSQQLVMTGCNWQPDGIQTLDRGVSWYEPVQNSQYAEILDPLTEHYPVAGVLMCGSYGEVVAVQLEMPEYEIGGREKELHKPFLLVAENRKSGLKTFGTVQTRVVCMNTYSAAIGEKGDKSLPNSQDSYAILKFRTRIQEKAIASHQNYVEGLNWLFKTKADNSDIDTLVQELFPKPTKPQMVQLWEDNQDVLNGDKISETIDKRGQRAAKLYQNDVDRKERYAKELIRNFFQFNDEHSYAANTRYGIWQATTQFFNHSNEWKSEEDTHSYNILFGDKAKQMNTAWQVLIK